VVDGHVVFTMYKRNAWICMYIYGPHSPFLRLCGIKRRSSNFCLLSSVLSRSFGRHILYISYLSYIVFQFLNAHLLHAFLCLRLVQVELGEQSVLSAGVAMLAARRVGCSFCLATVGGCVAPKRVCTGRAVDGEI
jgi:hypothetical protein